MKHWGLWDREHTDDNITDNSSDLCQKFWQTIGSTVTELTFDKLSILRRVKTDSLVVQLKAIIGHFNCLKKLKLEMDTLEIVSLIFSMQEKDVEIIEVSDIRGDYRDANNKCIFAINENGQNGKPEEVGSKNWEVLPAFENLIKCFTSLKRISFPCSLAYHYAVIIKPISYFSQNVLGADEIIFEMDCKSSNRNIYISAMEIEVSNNELSDNILKTSIVKAIDIFFIFFGNQFADLVYNSASESYCIFEHNICTNKLVRELRIIDTVKTCLQCFEYLVKSFPNIMCWKPVNRYLPLNSTTVVLMSKHLPNYSHLPLIYSECLDSFPAFAQLKYLDICLDVDQTSAGLYHLCECCPNLEHFMITFSYSDIFRSTVGQAITNGIVTHLKKLKFLEIDESVKIDSLGLKAIGSNLKQLTTLSFSCDENAAELLQLLKELPHLECIDYILNFARRKLTRQSLNALNSVDQIVSSRDAGDILPDELWAQVFENLPINDQVTCRCVCKQWWNVLNSFPCFRRPFKLRSCVLKMDTNPCKTFKNTQFNFNSLLFQGPIIICDHNVNEFWSNIGRSINEIYFATWMNVERWSKLSNGGMIIQNFPALKSITFVGAKVFFELLSQHYDTIGPMLKLLKTLVIYSFSEDMEYEIREEPDMTNLEYVQISGVCSWERLKLFVNWISKCPMLCTLDLNNYRSSKSEIPSEFTPIFGQLKHLRINGTIDENESEFIANNCKILETLTFQNLNSILTQNVFYCDGTHRNYDISEEIGFRNTAISLFQRMNLLTSVLFLGQAKVTFKYQLETSCYSKNLVESKIASQLLSKQIVHTYWSAQ